jgi:hypothetical protein
MKARDLMARLAGVACLGASWGACLWLRAKMLGPPHDPTLIEAGLVLASFVLTAIGLLLVLNGARMLQWPGPARTDDAAPPPAIARPDALAALSLIDERAGRVDALTRRAIRTGAERKGRG